MIANGTEITYKAGGTTCTVDQEQALNTSTGGFRGRCSTCRQVGHKCKDCKNEPSNVKRSRFTGKCNWCGKVGHKEKKCFAKQRGDQGL